MSPTREPRALASPGASPGLGSGAAGGLPVPLTPLVGRRKEISEVGRQLWENRLVTLVGPGGVGKTRLALETVTAHHGGTRGGTYEAEAYWVELAPLGGPGLVEVSVADAVGAHSVDGTRAALAAALGGREALVVLDNCEHVVSDVAALCSELLGACGGLRILATSREPLGVHGEVVWPVAPLEVPADRGAGATALAGCEAVELFVQRAGAASPSFKLTDANSGAVAEICQQLDGLPLAIELAVANLRMLPAEEMARSLGNVLGLLVGGLRTAPARHQTLRAALDWSHQLLSVEEQELLRRLSVFAGSFTLEAARVVAAGGSATAPVYDLLRRLVEKSLVVAGAAGGEACYHLLSTVRQYGAERLVAAGEEDRFRRAHLRWCVERAGLAEERLAGPGQAEELRRLDREVNDVRAALEFAKEAGEAATALELASALLCFWYLHGHYAEGRKWLDWAVVAGAGAPAPVRAKALRASGRLAFLQCDYAAAVRRLDAALRIYSALGDTRGTAATFQVLGSVAREQGRYQQAEHHHSEGMALFEAAGDQRGVANAHGYLGFAAWLQGDLVRARRECQQALEMFRGLDDAEGRAWSLLSLGVVAQYEGDLAQAEELLAESRSISEQIGFREGIAWSAHQLGLLALRRGARGPKSCSCPAWRCIASWGTSGG